MAAKIEFYFDVGSPSAYLAWAQLPEIASGTGAEIEYRPVLVGGVFQSTGNVSPASIPSKGKYFFHDMRRCAEHAGVAYQHNSAFPINTIPLMRGTVAALREGVLESYLDAIYPAFWRDDVNLGEPEKAASCLKRAGLDPDALFRLAKEQSVKDELLERSNAAVERGVFGVPTMFVGDEMFFGQDRLHFVREAVSG